MHRTNDMGCFYMNEDIDMTKIVDSMQLDSNQIIASLTKDNIKATIEVRGEVKVWWNEKAGNPTEGDYYIYPSEFPEKLKRLIADQETSDEGHWTLDPRVYVSENNWFELFVGKTGEPIPTAECVDIEGYTPEELYDMLFDAINDYKKDRWLKDLGGHAATRYASRLSKCAMHPALERLMRKRGGSYGKV